MEKLTCALTKQLDMVDYLKSIGHHPKRILNNNYWYLSPLREESAPSSKVDRKRNVWYDHGSGEGGDLIGFCIRYHRRTVKDLLAKPESDQLHSGFSFHHPALQGPKNPAQYPEPHRERAGGLYRSLIRPTPKKDRKPIDYLILNPLCFVHKGIESLLPYHDILLYLDHDPAGRKTTKELLRVLPRARDPPQSYRQDKGLNDHLKRQQAIPRQAPKTKRQSGKQSGLRRDGPWHEHLGRAQHPKDISK